MALERRRQRMKEVFERALAKEQPITVPADVVGEWWRGHTEFRHAILQCVDVEPLTLAMAKLAGEALAEVSGATLVDAIVMASAASRGDIVYSSDIADLERFRHVFPGVEILQV
jgi:hypothetical protein